MSTTIYYFNLVAWESLSLMGFWMFKCDCNDCDCRILCHSLSTGMVLLLTIFKFCTHCSLRLLLELELELANVFYEIRKKKVFIILRIHQVIQIAQKATTTNTPKMNERNIMGNLVTGNMFLGRAYWTTKYLYTP